MERKGFGWGRGPLANKVWIQLRSLAGSAPRPCGHEDWAGKVAAGRAQQSSVCALPHAYRRSSGAVRVLDVRIDWHVKRPTNNKVKLRAVWSQAGEGLTGRRQQIKCTQLQLSGSREQRAAWSFCLHLRTPWGSAGVREMCRHRAQQRSTPVKREATIAGLASEGLALILGSAGAGSSAVVGPMPLWWRSHSLELTRRSREEF